ncbi:MAG: hypothetical protein HRT69_15790 [Flavobacteriaceae bacterium]|nr:hypothetical protein [Flavobacteriaceae bacterium]
MKKFFINLFNWIFKFNKMRKARRARKMMASMDSFLNERTAKKNIVKKALNHYVGRKNKIKGLTKHESHQLASKTFAKDLHASGLKVDINTLEFKNA